MARKNVGKEPEYHRRSDNSTIIYYYLIIPVILQRSHNKGHLNLETEVLKVLVQEF